MKQIITLLLLLVTLAAQSVWAQKLSVELFALAGNDLTASTQPRLDGNDEPCALVKVGLPLMGAVFEGEIVGETKNQYGEYWVYMVAGSKYLNVKQASMLPLKITFADYGIKSLEGKCTYQLMLTAPSPKA